MIRLPLALLLAWATLEQSAQAQVHYTCNRPVGNITTCHDSDGNIYTVMKDAAGAMVMDSDGDMSRIQNDPVMGTVVHRPDGSLIRSHTDAAGNIIYEDDDGNQVHCRPYQMRVPGQTDMDCE